MHKILIAMATALLAISLPALAERGEKRSTDAREISDRVNDAISKGLSGLNGKHDYDKRDKHGKKDKPGKKDHGKYDKPGKPDKPSKPDPAPPARAERAPADRTDRDACNHKRHADHCRVRAGGQPLGLLEGFIRDIRRAAS